MRLPAGALTSDTGTAGAAPLPVFPCRARQWYPVGWCADLPVGRPHRVTLFDTDYAVVRRRGGPPSAHADVCPHRLAALSEGRVTAGGELQCAYHGWRFAPGDGAASAPQAPGAALPCAQTFPCLERGGLLWLLPCSDEGAADAAPPPAVPPELKGVEGDAGGGVVRDIPVDYTVLLENVVDFDHGVFAHQAKGFDLYGGSRERPQRVVASLSEGGAPTVRMETDAVPKVLHPHQAERSSPSGAPRPLTATSEFVAPCYVRTQRADAEGRTKFATVFWLVPTGVGRSRFLSRAISSFNPPRWLLAIGIYRFLDQDTYLLCTENTHTLAAEFVANAKGLPFVRRRTYRYASPGERLLAKLGEWLDGAVPSQPKRYDVVPAGGELAFYERAFAAAPRAVTLDRWAQGTAVSPPLQDAFRNLQVLQVSLAAAAVACVCYAARGGGGRAVAITGAVIGLLAAAACRWLAGQLAGPVKTEAHRDADLLGIPALVPDPQ